MVGVPQCYVLYSCLFFKVISLPEMLLGGKTGLSCLAPSKNKQTKILHILFIYLLVISWVYKITYDKSTGRKILEKHEANKRASLQVGPKAVEVHYVSSDLVFWFFRETVNVLPHQKLTHQSKSALSKWSPQFSMAE